MIDDVMHVIIPSSSHYVPYLAVLLTSILCNKNDEDKLYFHIMSEDITEADKMRLEEVRKFGDFDIEYVEMNPDDIKDVPVCKEFYINNLCNYKMKIASIFKDIKKALVLEVDMIVLSSLRELFDFDMGESAFAAVKDPWCEEFQEIFDIPKKYRYCNTGMFLANLELWREKNYEQKMFENIKKYGSKLIFPDQDIFNRTFYLETVYLPQKWNVYSNVPYTHEDEKEEAFKDAENGSGLIHYASEKKPWLYAEDCTFSSIWWNYARKLSFYELILERMMKNRDKLELYYLTSKIYYRKNVLRYWFYKFISNFVSGKRKEKLLNKRNLIKQCIRTGKASRKAHFGGGGLIFPAGLRLFGIKIPYSLKIYSICNAAAS